MKILVKKVDISRMMVRAQQIKKEKIKKKEKENKRARTGGFNFSQQRLDGRNRSQFLQKSFAPTPSSSSAQVLKLR